LDPLGRQSFLALLDRLHEAGTTILMISHNADAIAEHAQRVVVLEQGSLLMDGEAGQVLSENTFLKEHGIGVGQAAQIAALLEAKGIAMEPGTVRYDDLLRQMIAIGRRLQQ